MPTSNHVFQREDVCGRKSARRTCSRLLALLVLCSFGAGCDAIKNHECCLFKPGGIFADQGRSEVERLSSRKEDDVVARASAASERRDVWEPTESELQYAKNHNVDLKKYVWSAQRPNGGVLFPRQLTKRGPVVLMEPGVISAPVGSDVILVASYVGEDNQHLRVGERLDWDMAGVGQFVSTNPNRSTTCLQCPWTKTSRDVSGVSQTTETSGQLYRITRGTEPVDDDITILRGQSWMAITSYEEGTSTVSVAGQSVPNWNNRRASSQIHWVDAAFQYPESTVGPVDRAGILETTVIRHSNAEPRVDWPVKYEVLSGEGGFDIGNGALTRTATALTDATGKSRVYIGQNLKQTGTTKVKVSIYRPGTENYPDAVVDSKTINYTWTNAAPLGVQVIAPPSAKAGDNLHYEIGINNFSDFYYQTRVEIEIPQGTRFVSINPPISRQDDPQKKLSWVVTNIYPKSCYSVDLYLRKEFDGVVPLRVQLKESAPMATATNDRPTYQNAPSSAVVPPTSNSDPNARPSL